MQLLYSIYDVIQTASPVSLALTLTVILASVVYYASKSRGLPPGPIGLPYFGYWPFLREKTCYLELAKFRKKYGDVSSFTSFGRLFINLGTIKAVREAHMTKSDYFAGRYTDYSLLNYIFEDGIVFTNGEGWRTLRKFFLQIFKERGMISVKDSMSGALYDSVKRTVKDLRAHTGKPVNIIEIMSLKCNTILRQTLFGENSVTDEQILAINKYYGQVVAGLTHKGFLLMGNVARVLIFPFKAKLQNSLKNHSIATKMLYKIIDDHKSTYDEENIRDIIDEFIKEKNKRERKGDPTAKYFTDKSLMSTLIQFVGDGASTVAGFVSVFLKNIVEHPMEQEKIYQELMEVVGADREPTMEDKSKLTYTNAYIMEVLRMSDFVPFFASLECTEETTIGGYRIPKGAITVSNMWSSHYDPEVYEEPEKFNPSRFIIKEGKRRPELPITFGIGKRSCLGEGFVMMQTFLFLTALIQNFRLTKVEGNAERVLEIVQSKEYLVYAELRKEN